MLKLSVSCLIFSALLSWNAVAESTASLVLKCDMQIYSQNQDTIYENGKLVIIDYDRQTVTVKTSKEFNFRISSSTDLEIELEMETDEKIIFGAVERSTGLFYSVATSKSGTLDEIENFMNGYCHRPDKPLF